MFRHAVGLLTLALTVALGCTTPSPPSPPVDDFGPYSEAREPCSDHNPLRNAYFGDIHVHTTFSFDAYAQNVRTTPAQAYGFAKGEEVLLPPLNEAGSGSTPTRLESPLDFVAVTDHAEFFGEVQVCLDPEAPGYNSIVCSAFRQANNNSTLRFGLRLGAESPERFSFCDDSDDTHCINKAASVWKTIQEAADNAYDKGPSCSFTTFIGYEYSAATGVSNLHRNVLFRNDAVPNQPISYMEEPTPAGLWGALKDHCLDSLERCDVLAVPHNSNLSNGRMFTLDYPEGATLQEQQSLASLRGSMEPLVEIYQHKADSECSNRITPGFGATDEWCSFEKYHVPPTDYEDCGDQPGNFGMNGGGCVSRLDFVRNALLRGMEEEQRLGVNPLKLGITAATDTHNGTPGAVEERTWQGHVGRSDVLPQNRLDGPTVPPGAWRYSPGGLTGLWAEENSRDSLFDAMKRKEAWGTSGPRISVRLFGGWEYPTPFCSDPKLLEKAYAQGVPMGGDLPNRGGHTTGPTFVVIASGDPGTTSYPGAPLAGIQIIKGSVSADQELQIEVFNVLTDSGSYATDPSTCAASGEGASSLCTTWVDPNFDPTDHAYYYARILQYPTCRWSSYLCNQLGNQPQACSNPEMPRLIEERAWTSPIWYSP